MDEEIARQFAIRDRWVRRIAAQATPEERVEAMMQLQQRTWTMLSQSPEAYARFLRRNFKARSVPVREADAT